MTSAQLFLGQSGRRPRLWVQRGNDIVGPYPFATVLRMIREGRIGDSQPVSADQKTWTDAAKVRELFQMEREGVLHAAESTQQFIAEERQRLQEKLHAPVRLALGFHPLLVTLAAMAPGGAVLAGLWLWLGLRPVFSADMVLFAAACLPVLLLTWGVADFLGDVSLRGVFGLTAAERRFLALHAPEEAFDCLGRRGRAVRRWLGRGEWLAPARVGAAEGYLHIFRTGEPVRDVAAEVALWDELARVLPPSLRNLCHPGPALREVQDIHTLPTWSRVLTGVTDGAALGNILNAPYHVWMDKFLRRARRKLHIGTETQVDFFLYSYQRITGEHILAAAVYPHATGEADSSMEVPSAAA